jgi:Protein-glutamine gamma-glutamyltransferase
MAKYLPIVYKNNFLSRDASPIWNLQTKWSGKRGVYSAFVESKTDLASKKDLAKIITGDENNWVVLGGGKQNVKVGQRISVAPLLAKLESMLREKVVFVAASGKLNTKFPEDPNKFATITVSEGSQTQVINSYFTNTPYQEADCDFAVRLIFSKAILETIGSAAYDATGQYIGSIPMITLNSKTMLIGDRGWFQNYTDYTQKVPQGFWQAENVIKVTNNLYWGFTGDNLLKTTKEWEVKLRNAYNNPNGQQTGKQRNDPLPGFTRGFDFIDVAAIAMSAFLYQTTEMEQ